MFSPDQYQLLDFGDGRRLERFGPWALDRPCPAAETTGRADPALWTQADARFERTDETNQGRWISGVPLPERWSLQHDPIVLELKRTDFGHLGVFPEQAANWDWIAEKTRRARETHQSPLSNDPTPPRILNLFAYTGGSTLTAAAAGARVTHVDAARNVVAWARRNAEVSGLADAPIRWIAEEASKFVRRELKRGNGYDAVILDPPTYGHGPRGEVWRLSKHLPGLLKMCGQLTAGRRQFLLVTCHTPKYTPDRLQQLVIDAMDGDADTVTAAEMVLSAKTGQVLPSGVVARWERVCTSHGEL